MDRSVSIHFRGHHLERAGHEKRRSVQCGMQRIKTCRRPHNLLIVCIRDEGVGEKVPEIRPFLPGIPAGYSPIVQGSAIWIQDPIRESRTWTPFLLFGTALNLPGSRLETVSLLKPRRLEGRSAVKGSRDGRRWNMRHLLHEGQGLYRGVIVDYDGKAAAEWTIGIAFDKDGDAVV